MRHNIQELVFFEKLTTVSRINSVFELIWHLDVEANINKTVINVLFRNIATGEYVTDSIAPEFLKHCSVGSFFKAGRKLEDKDPSGEYEHISIDVPETGYFKNLGLELLNAGGKSYFADSSMNGWLADLCKNQKCMVFPQGEDNILIPCSVIAFTYYLLSHSMRVQLLAQNLQGLYEAIHYDPFTETARIILNTNARTEDAKHIARFALSKHATECWDNVMNGMRKLTYTSKSGRNFSHLIAKIPFVQNKLDMIIRCDILTNPAGGRTLLVHDIIEEWGELPFKKLCIARRANAPPAENANVVTKQDADTDHRVTNRAPSKVYSGHWVEQFEVANNPLWDDLEFEEEILPSRHEATKTKTLREKLSGKTVSLSSQQSKGNNPDEMVAKALLGQEEPKDNNVARMSLVEFRDMVDAFQRMDGVTNFFISSDMKVPLRRVSRRHRFTARESYDNSPTNRRHYLYVTFVYKSRHVCLVEFDQLGLSARVATYMFIASAPFNRECPVKAAQLFVEDAGNEIIVAEWAKINVVFDTKAHPVNSAKEHWQHWREKVLEFISSQS